MGFCLISIAAGCMGQPTTPVSVHQASVTPVVAAPALPPGTHIPSLSPPPLPSITTAPTATSIPAPVCLREGLPANFADSPVIRGWKTFSAEQRINVRYLYFPADCPTSQVDHDAKLLFWGSLLKEEETGVVVLHPVSEGILAPLHKHLAWYDFWAMGPEDYPMLLKSEGGHRPNIVLLRSERLFGDGAAGSTDANRMVGLAEHEYIHTVQGRNNPDLARMIWADPVYRAYIERYANIGNNATARYFRAAPSILTLLQFLDGLNQRNELEGEVSQILKQKGGSLDAFLGESYPVYGRHLRTFLVNVSGQKYVDQVSSGKVSPLYLVERAGSGKLDAYDLLRQLYNENIRQYNRWFYGSSPGNALPVQFDELFSAN